jgi:predicted transcriptional regulator
MPSAKEQVAEVLKKQPEDATYEEIIRELAFEKMVQNGMADSRAGKVIPNQEMRLRIASWRK